MRERKIRWLQVVVHLAALLPLALLAWDYWHGLFIIDPIKEITTRTGKTALILLLLSLAVTPVSMLTGLRQLPRARRTLGLYAFMYASLHFLTFVGLDYEFAPDLIGEAIFYQRYVVVGFAAGVILLLLTITSIRGWKRRLGRNWRRLHYLTYLVGVLAVVHFLWLVKDVREPLRYGALLVVLLIMRIPVVGRALLRVQRRFQVKGENESSGLI